MVELRVALGLLVAATALAGCSGGGGDGDGGPDPAEGPPPLQATATTGVIRGVVVDEAIRPLPNVTVQASGPGGASATATTGEDGFFGLQGLAPGNWFLAASKVAYESSQVGVEVVAGLDSPPIAKIQMVFVPGAVPFQVLIHYEGFLECAVPGANVCFILNFYPCLVQQAAGQPCSGNVTNDNSVFQIHEQILSFQRNPDWTQAELVWESTQAVTDWLRIRMSANSPDDGSGIDERNLVVSGPSPLMASLNASVNEEWELGVAEGLALESFAAGNDMLCGLPNVGVNPCQGVTLNQRVDFYFHFFFGYAPPEGWRFSADGDVPPPQ